jgi:hypothetical protein
VKEVIKAQVRELLKQREYDHLVDLCVVDRHAWQELRFRLYEIDERIRWSAIEAAAKLMKRWWQLKQQEKVRDFIRNLFWSMTDESGGIGWSSPQTISETIVNIPEILDPYGSMMIAYSIEEAPLMKGGLWGIGRLGKMIADSMDFFQEKILAVFQNDDPEVLGLAAWAMGEVGFKPSLSLLEKLRKRNEPVRIYINGDFSEKPLGQWAEEAANKIAKFSLEARGKKEE